MMKIDIETINSQGWIVIQFQGDILEMAHSIGVPVPNRLNGNLVDRLQVLKSEESHLNSLSFRYGKGAFPYHTDGAHHKEVPRLLLMRLAAGCKTKRPTFIKDILSVATPEERKVLEEELWIYSSGQHAYLSSVYSQNNESNVVLRFDRDCMKPAILGHNKSLAIVESLLNRAKTISLYWSENRLLILNNRRLLHARAREKQGDDDRFRILERVLVL